MHAIGSEVTHAQEHVTVVAKGGDITHGHKKHVRMHAMGGLACASGAAS